jgi:alpha-glucosidase
MTRAALLVAAAVVVVGGGCAETDRVCDGAKACDLPLGDATLTATHVDGAWRLAITSTDAGTPVVVWATVPGRSPVEAHVGGADIDYNRGAFQFWDWTTASCTDARVVELVATDAGVVVRGAFEDCGGLRYELAFTPVSANRVDFSATVLEADGTRSPEYNRTVLVYASDADEGFFGFGAQYSYVNMKGRRLPIWCQEQGHGRGVQPISDALAGLAGGNAGDWHTSYTGVPYYLSNRNRGVFVDNLEYLFFDMTAPDATAIEVWSNQVRGGLLHGKQPLDIVEEYTNWTGRMRPLPEWSQRGSVVRSFNGGTQVAMDQLAELDEVGAPLAALWLEDWAGTRDTGFGTRMLWNWSPDEVSYPNYAQLVADLKARGIPVLAYFNPFVSDPKGIAVTRNVYAESVGRDYLVKNRKGENYKIEMGGFTAYMVDLSNPEARVWLKEIIKGQIALGIAGWMADFGEALPPDAVLHSGVDALAYHNQYALDWAQLNRDAAEEMGVADEVVFFSRGGIARSPGATKLFWLGDQLTTWDEYDGIKTLVPAMLSSGLSGYTLQHPDTGGWLSVRVRDVFYRRTKELLQRWIEISAFTAWLRLITTNEPESNHQYNSDRETLLHFTRFSKVFAALAPYRKQLMQEAWEKGYPLVRHPLLHYPDDSNVYTLTEQFMLGSELMVAPVVNEGADTVQVYLPAGEWVHIWSDEVYGSPSDGQWTIVNAPIGQPAVFYRRGSAPGEAFVQALIDAGLR